jgi:CMP/dCMP kinase
MSSDAAGTPPRGLTIAISGKSGCGNTSVSRIVAARLGIRLVNYTFKDLARDRGMSFEELAARAETDPQYDFTLDDMQVRRAEAGPCVLGSRLAIWLLREKAFTVYLEAPLEVRAARIAQREGKDPEVAFRETEARDRRDHDRYARLYGYDVDDFSFAAIVLDAARLTQEEEADRIIAAASSAAGR